MAIGFRAGTSAGSGSSQTTSQTVTIPGTVAAGDIVYVFATQVPISASTPTLSAASTATAPVQVSTTQHVDQPTIPATAACAVFRIVAGASDAGATVTISSTITGFWSLTLGSWSGASTTAPEDVIGGVAAAVAAATVTCPSETTSASGDWAIYYGGGAAENGSLTIPSGTTARQNNVTSVSVASVFCDSNGSVGAGGTGIGGGVFTAGSNANNLLCAFTIGLQVPGTVTPAKAQAQRGAARGAQAARRGSGKGSAGVPVTAPPVTTPAPFRSPGSAVPPHPAASRGQGSGRAGVPVTVAPATPAPFTSPRRATAAHPAARRGSGHGLAGVPVLAVAPAPPSRRAISPHPAARTGAGRGRAGVPVTPSPAPFTRPVRAVQPHAARRGSAAGSAGAPVLAVAPVLAQPRHGAVPPHPAARRGSGRGSAGTPVTAPPLTLAVTATQAGSTASGIGLDVRVVTGQAASPVGTPGTSLTANDKSYTPAATGSWIYGAVTDSIGSAFTAAAGTTFRLNVDDTADGETLGTCRTTGTVTGGTPVTVGSSTAGSGGGALALLEIKAGAGLAEHASTPAAADTTSAATISTASFSPPAGALLVALVASDVGGAGPTTVTVSGGGLTWTQQAVAGGGGSNYLSAIWTALVPGGATPATAQQARRAVAAHPAARRGSGTGSAGAPVSSAPATPAPFASPARAIAPHPAARRGQGAGTAGVPVTFHPPPFTAPRGAERGQQAARTGRGTGLRGVPVTIPPVITPAPFESPGKAAKGAQAAARSTGKGLAGAPVVPAPPPVPAPFAQPGRAVAPHPAAVRGRALGSAGAPVIPVTPAPFASPARATAPHPAARRGSGRGQARPAVPAQGAATLAGSGTLTASGSGSGLSGAAVLSGTSLLLTGGEPSPAQFPPPTVPAFPAGYQPFQADFMTWWYDNLGFHQQRPCARVIQGFSTTSIPSSGAETQIGYDTVLEDEYSGWGLVTSGAWSPPAGFSGWYHVLVTVYTGHLASGQVLRATLGGSYTYDLGTTPGATGHDAGVEGQFMVYLIGGQDYVFGAAELFGGSAASTSSNTGQQSSMEVMWLSQ